MTDKYRIVDGLDAFVVHGCLPHDVARELGGLAAPELREIVAGLHDWGEEYAAQGLVGPSTRSGILAHVLEKVPVLEQRLLGHYGGRVPVGNNWELIRSYSEGGQEPGRHSSASFFRDY